MEIGFPWAESDWTWNVLGLLTIPALVALNGFFVAAEFALVAVRKTRIEEMVNQREAGAETLSKATEHLDRSIAATQLGITLASIALGWTGEPALAHLFQPIFDYLTPSGAFVAAHTAATAVAFSLITFMHVVFGELIPKSMALQAPDRTALWIAYPLVIFIQLSRPIVVVMNGTANFLLSKFGFRAASGEEMAHSVEELLLLVEDVEEAGMLDADQAEYVQNVFRLSDNPVSACLIPRDKMAALELHTPPEQVLELVRSGAHTRIPVYEGDPENIVGIVNTKDLFYLFSLQGVVVLQDALYPPLFLKPDNTMAEALRLFRRAKRPMALVRDDAGKIHGLITLEDVLEEIVGDIEDEHDRPAGKMTLKRTRVVRPSATPGQVNPIRPPGETKRA